MQDTIAQVPVVHVPVAFAGAHATPQPPQFVLVFSDASQPSVRASPLQLPYPLLHAMEQLLPLHVGVPLAALQAWPHPPQLARLLVRLISQPLLRALLSQLPNPGLHVIEQLPALHNGVPLAGLHGCPHAPQCANVVFVLTSQPFPDALSQLPQPVVQLLTEHVPVAHVPVALAGEQATPQAPQLVTLVSAVSHPFCGKLSQLP